MILLTYQIYFKLDKIFSQIRQSWLELREFPAIVIVACVYPVVGMVIFF